MTDNILSSIQKILSLSQEIFTKYQSLESGIGVINTKGDETIAMDKKMEDIIIDYSKSQNLPVRIFSEGIGIIDISKNPSHLLVFDPLDGSTNYAEGQNMLPYGLLITCFKGLKPTFSDIIASGMYEHTNGKSFLYNGDKTVDEKGLQINLNKIWSISPKTSVYFDFYYQNAVKKFGPLAGKVHLRWGGSNISSLLYVLSQVGAVMGSVQMRPEEIGAVVSLIHGAGGKVSDLKGRDMILADFSLEKVYPFIAGNRDIVDFLLTQL